jgi:hypothetical protein
MHAGALNVKAVAAVVPQQAFGHLTASGVGGAEDEDALHQPTRTLLIHRTPLSARP